MRCTQREKGKGRPLNNKNTNRNIAGKVTNKNKNIVKETTLEEGN